ncbi:sulfite exporter TauE/SafE family protein [uncultured Flavobacterium sp.]|uniref:sulfite exporter TauE/SafE family protein n=1 Tax=uncultured Flavobacterium sp. TaxID=165435 RepID=UPI0025CF5E3B|nr:sulfite exporter TauE/SafE family protein [uncultured Flavobacterium sp.]
MELIAGYCGAFVIGLTLGLMGSGGSILTVPLLVYVFCIDPVIATAYSLFIVGTTSAFGTFKNHLNNNVAFKTGLIIALPSFLSVYLTRKYIVTQLPETLEWQGMALQRHTFIMVLFAVVMALAAASMLFRKFDNEEASVPKKMKYIVLLPYIAFIGIIMGLVGAGGGFLIIPMLVFFGGLAIKKAVGTSLFIITLNALMGFSGDVQRIPVDWGFLLPFTLISVFGIFAGTYLHKFVNEVQLKKGFGIFVLAMALFILSKEILGY